MLRRNYFSYIAWRIDGELSDLQLAALQVNGAAHTVPPVQPIPPHWPYSATVPPEGDGVVVGAGAVVPVGAGAATPWPIEIDEVPLLS